MRARGSMRGRVCAGLAAAVLAVAMPVATARAQGWPASAALIDARAEALAPGSHATPQAVAQALTAGLTQDMEKLYALYRWVTRHVRYDTEAYFAGDLRSAAGAANAFNNGRAVCDGYAELLQVMARAVGLRMEKVVGYGKGLGHADGGLPAQSNHAWNAVMLGQRWYLMDATWDAGHVNGSTRQFVRNTAGFKYFLADPELFSTSHFPSDERWQLQRGKLDFPQFLALAKIRPDIGAFAIDVREHRARLQGGSAAPVVFDFGPAAQTFSAELRRAGRRVEGHWTLLHRSADTGTRMLVAAPEPGDYELSVFAPRRAGDATSEQVLDYRVAITSTGPHARGFPLAFGEYGRRHIELKAPLAGVLPAGKPVLFALRAEGAVEVFVVHSGQLNTTLAARDGGHAGELVLQPGEATVYARFDAASRTGQALLRYRVE